MRKDKPQGRGERLRIKSAALWLLVICASAITVGLFRGVLMGAAGDTTADRVLGQLDFAHGGINMVTRMGGPMLRATRQPIRPCAMT